MLRSVELKDYMQHQPVTVLPDMSVYEAAKRILEAKVSGAVVVDDESMLLGMISELDCLRVILSAVYNDQEYAVATVRDIMTTDVEVHHPHDDIVDVASSMLQHSHRRRPVVHRGRLVGQVTCRQILKVVADNWFGR